MTMKRTTTRDCKVRPQRKFKITNCEYDERGVIVRVGGTYNKFAEEFYPVEKHYE